MVANRRQSYNLTIELQVEGIPDAPISRNTLDLKNPFFRFTGQPVQPPPGCNETSPSEDYWQQLDISNAATIATQQPLQANGLPTATLNNNTNLVGIQPMIVNGQSLDVLTLGNGNTQFGGNNFVSVMNEMSTEQSQVHVQQHPQHGLHNGVGVVGATGANVFGTGTLHDTANFPVSSGLMVNDLTTAPGQSIANFKP